MGLQVTESTWVAYNSETGQHISEPMSYSEAKAIANDWNHDGAPNLFRVQEHDGRPGLWFGGAGF